MLTKLPITGIVLLFIYCTMSQEKGDHVLVNEESTSESLVRTMASESYMSQEVEQNGRESGGSP